MHFLRAFALLLLLAQALPAGQPTPILPDPKLSPGDTFDVTAEDVCVPGYSKKVRAVPTWLKRQAYAEYGITEHKPGDYEVDHLIPLSLGGSNSPPLTSLARRILTSTLGTTSSFGLNCFRVP